MSPRPSQTSCRCQIVATNVGTSVWPAEYSVASPYSASAPTAATSALSSWRARDSTVGGRRGRGLRRRHRPDLRQAEVGRRPVGGQRGDLERGGGGIVRHRHLQGGRRLLLDAEGGRDRPGNERRPR